MENKKKYGFIICLILLIGVFFTFLTPQATAQTSGSTYPIYGGWNNYDTYTPDWTAGSDNVVWDFGSEEMVYRNLHALKLKYNPKGEFHMIRNTPLAINSYKWLSFTGRSDGGGLNFGLTFIDSANQPVGNTLNFSDHGGTPEEHYWTQYNFAIPDFNVTSASVSGFRITQVSNDWGAEIFLDEIYLSSARGEDINPALPTPNPGEPTPKAEKIKKYPPDTNPFVYIVPAIFAVIIVLFH